MGAAAIPTAKIGGADGLSMMALGGDGGLGGDGRSVVAESNGEIRTTGAFSSGILAQSVGGGGGAGGNGMQFDIEHSNNPTDYDPYIGLLEIYSR